MKILFIGNSHTYYNEMAHMFTELYRLSGEVEPEVFTLTCGGKSLEYHSTQANVRFNIKYGKYDMIVLQNSAHPFPGVEKHVSDVGLLMEFINKTSSRTCLYMTWGNTEHPEWQADMIEGYEKAAETYGTMLAPVGRVWEYVRFNHPEVNLFFTDGNHAGIHGSYLAACVIYCTLTGKTEVNPDLSDSFYDMFDREQIKVIHSAIPKVLK